MRKRRVILYDDEINILNVIKDYFTLRGYETLTYQQPVVCPYQESGAHCAAPTPCADIIMTDYNMPGMNGIELLRVQSQRGCKVPAENRAIISGNLAGTELQDLKELRCMFFKKPFSFRDISRWLDEREKTMDLSQQLTPIRRETRYASNDKITYRIPHQKNVLTGVAVNTSLSGICLKFHTLVEPGQTIIIHPDVPRSSRAASIRWVRPAGDGLYMAGLQYA